MELSPEDSAGATAKAAAELFEAVGDDKKLPNEQRRQAYMSAHYIAQLGAAYLTAHVVSALYEYEARARAAGGKAPKGADTKAKHRAEEATKLLRNHRSLVDKLDQLKASIPAS